MAGKLCIYIRDRLHPADLYDSSSHWFAVSIHEVGSNEPLCWKGTNYNWKWLSFQGQFSKVADEFEVPAGTYLVKGYAMCSNVVTHIAWVQVNDDETSSVNLIPTGVYFCLKAAVIGAVLGTVVVKDRHVPIAEIAPAEVKAFEKAAGALAARLPEDQGIPLIELEDLRKLLMKKQKE